MGAVRALADRYLELASAARSARSPRAGDSGMTTRCPTFPRGRRGAGRAGPRHAGRAGRTPATDDADTQCDVLLRDRSGSVDLHDASEDLRPLRIFGSPVQLRAAFDLMPKATAPTGTRSAARMEAVPAAYDSLPPASPRAGA